MTETASAFDLPFDEAIAYLRQKANVPTRSWRDVWGAAHSHSFMVAGAASDALVSDFRSEIDKALADGTTLAEFRAGFDAIVEKHGWDYTGERNWRTRVIFETNLRTAHAAGQYAQMTKPGTVAAFPYWQYNHSGAVHPRQSHLALDGNVYRWDDPIWTTHYPPNGFGCGCFVTVVSDSDLGRLGKDGLDIAPDLRLPGGGMTGVDPGFTYNPGQRWLSGGRPGEPVATEGLIVKFGELALAGGLPFNATVPVAAVPAGLAQALDVPAGTHARLSVATIRDHARRAELEARDYARQAGRAIEAGIRRGPKGRLTAIVEIDGKPFLVGFKVTRHGELLITTLHRANPRQIRMVKGWPEAEG